MARKDFEGSGGAAVTVAMVPPEDPDVGDLFYDQNPGVELLSVWDGTAWLPINEAPVLRASTVPQAPREGELWFNEAIGQLFAFNRDTNQWYAVAPNADLADEIARLEGLIEDNDGDIEDLQEEQATQNGRLDALESGQATQDGRLDQIDADQITQNGRLDDLEGSQETQDDRLDVLEEGYPVLDGRVGKLEASQLVQDSRLDQIDADQIAQDERLQDLEDGQVIQDQKLESLDKEVIQHGQQIKDLRVEQTLQTGQIQANYEEIEALKVQKGAAVTYTIKANDTIDFAARNGEMIVNQLQASLVTFISLAPYDNEGKLVKAVHEGDIVEIVDPETYATCQFLIGEDVTNAQGMQVTYMSGLTPTWWVTSRSFTSIRRTRSRRLLRNMLMLAIRRARTMPTRWLRVWHHIEYVDQKDNALQEQITTNSQGIALKADITYSDAEDKKLQDQIDEIEEDVGACRPRSTSMTRMLRSRKT